MSTQHLDFKSGWDNSAFFSGLRTMETGVQKSAESISRAFKGASVLVTGIGAALSGAAVKGLVDFASNIADSAGAIEMSTDAFQGFVGVLEAGGVEQEKFEGAMVKLIKAMEEARSGNTKMVETFDRLGVSWSNLSTSSPEAVLKLIATGLSEAADSGNAFDAATDIFGKGSQKLIAQLKANGSEFEANTKLVSKLTQEQIESLDRLGDAWSKFQRTVTVGAGGWLLKGLEKLNEIIEPYEDFASTAKVYDRNSPAAKKEAFNEWSGLPRDGNEKAFSELPSMIAPKDPRVLELEEALDKELAKSNLEAVQGHDKRMETEKKAAEQTKKIQQQLAESLKDRTEQMRDFYAEGMEGEAKLIYLERQRLAILKEITTAAQGEKAALVDKLASKERELATEKRSQAMEKMSKLKTRVEAEMAKEVDFNLMDPQGRRDAVQESRRTSRAESRAKREEKAGREPWRKFKDARYDGGGAIGGNMQKVMLDNASIKELATELNTQMNKLIVS